MIKILITGANGQLGQSFQASESLAAHLGIELIFADRKALDITQPESIEQYCRKINLSAIVNAAAYTAVDQAESEIELATLVNAVGPKNLATYCQKNTLAFIHVSTDYVFNGEATGAYKETDPVDPLGVYGKTKYAGEVAVLDALPSAIILRTSWVFSEFNNNFLKTMLRLTVDRDTLSIVADQWGAPTYAPHIAEAILAILNPNSPLITGGVYHFSGHKKTNWQLFATFIFEQKCLYDASFNMPQVLPITTDQYPTPAARPMNSHLSNQKILAVLPNLNCDWQQGVMRSLHALQKS